MHGAGRVNKKSSSSKISSSTTYPRSIKSASRHMTKAFHAGPLGRFIEMKDPQRKEAI